jgi:hypothetical protein
MSKENQRLLSIIRRLTNLVILLIVFNLVLPLLIINGDEIANYFEEIGVSKEVRPFIDAEDDALLSKARKTFKSITLVSQPPQRTSLIALGKEL